MRFRRPIGVNSIFAALVLMAVSACVSISFLQASPVLAVSCGGVKATIVGTGAGERIRGTVRRDVIVARGGADTILGRGGNDVICGGPGNDTVAAGPGQDRVRGDEGKDRLNGGGGPDVLTGLDGADVINGGGGNDDLRGLGGNDVLRGDAGADSLIGGVGHDSANGGTGNDSCVAEVLVSCNELANHAPTNISLSNSTLSENEPSGTPVGDLSATDADAGQTHAFTLVAGTGSTDNASFAIVGSQLRTAAIFDFENQISYSIRVRATDSGAPAKSFEKTFTITVTDAQEPPQVDTSSGSTAYTEGDPPVAVDSDVTVMDPDDTNIESATVSITGNFQTGDVLAFTDTASIVGTYSPGGGVLDLTGTDTLANYQAALRSIAFSTTNENPDATKTISFTVNDGLLDSNTDTKTIDITGINDIPAITAPASVTAPHNVNRVISGISINDPDAGSDDIQLTLTVGDGTLTVSTTVVGGVASGDMTGNGTGTVVIHAAQSKINATLGDPAGLTYNDGGAGGTSDTLDIDTNDLGNNGTGGAMTDSDSITIIFNDPPIATGQTVSVAEDTATTVTLTATDAEADPIEFKITELPFHGDLHEGTTSAGTLITSVPHTLPADKVTYVPDEDGNGTPFDTFKFKANDGNDSNEATVTIDVTEVNDAPTAVGDSLSSVAEDSSQRTISFASLTDNDGRGAVNESDQTLTITGVSNPVGGAVSISGTDVLFTPTADFNGIASFDYTLQDNGTTNGAPDAKTDTGTASFTITEVNDAPMAVDDSLSSVDEDSGQRTISFASLTGNDGNGAVNESGQTLTITGVSNPVGGTVSISGTDVLFTPTANFNGTASFDYMLQDNGTTNGASDPKTDTGTASFTVTAVDDAPTAVADSATVLEDASATAVPVLTNDTDPDGGPKTISSATDPANGTVVLTGGSPGAHTGLTYQPDPEYCNDPPATTLDTFTYTLNGGSSTTVSMTVTCVNDAPVADDETFNGNDSAHGNTTMQVDDPDDNKSAPTFPHTEISGDILAGDTDTDGPGPLTITPGVFATNDGGTVTIEADGDFTFDPAASTSCTDTSDFFDYTVEDSGAPEQTDTGRVTISIAGCVWYVNNNASGNSGTSSQPFDTLAPAETASGANHTVFVFDGDNTTTGYTTGFQMNAGERLIGEHEGLVVDPDQGGGLTADSLHPANPGARPTLTDDNADVIDLDDGNEVRGFNIDPQGTGGGIAGLIGDTGGGTIDDVNIVDTATAGTQPGLELDSTTGTFNITNLTVATAGGATGVRLNNAGTTNFQSSSTITVRSTGGRALDATGTNMGTGSVFDDLTSTDSNNGGVSMVNTTGTTQLGDGSGADLNVTTISGGAAGLALNNPGSISVPATGTSAIHATGGPALDVSNATVSIDLDDADSSGSATDGIRLDNTAGTVTIPSSALLEDATGQDVDISGNNSSDTVDFTFNGSINDDLGQLVSVANQNGGLKDFNGAISDGNDDDGSGISLTNNTGTTIRFDGGVTLSTGPNAGFAATGGGSVVVTGSTNTITTSTGTALNFTNTDIGAADLTFQRITAGPASGAGCANGIVLNNTGAAGNLAVTGTGTAGSGGVIQNCDGADGLDAGVGLLLINTDNVSLSRMELKNHDNFAIKGRDVIGFTWDNNVVTGTNGTTSGEGGVYFRDNGGVAGLTGSASFTGGTIEGGSDDNVNIFNARGTLNRVTFTNMTIGHVGTLVGDDGVSIEASSGATINTTINGTTFLGTRGDAINITGQTPSTMDSDIIDSFMTNTQPGGPVAAGGRFLTLTTSGTATYEVSGNGTVAQPLSGSAGNMIFVNSANTGGNLSGRIASNRIGLSQASGIAVESNGSGNHTTLIDGNNVSNYNNHGIVVTFGDTCPLGAPCPAAPTLNATVTNNVVHSPGTLTVATNDFNGFHLNSGTTAVDSFTACLDLRLNTLTGSGHGDTPPNNQEFRLRQRQSTTVLLPGYAGANNDDVAVVAFLQGQNTESVGAGAASNTVPTGGGYIGGAACTQP